MTLAKAIYLLCAATSVAAAALLLRQYRATGSVLLLWSVVGFVGLALNNVFVYVDLVLVPTVDLAAVRALAGAIGLGGLLYGLICETRK